MKNDFPILEFDPNSMPVIEPQNLFSPHDEMPEHCVLCFFQEAIDALEEKGLLKEIYSFTCEMGKIPLYVLEFNDRKIGLMHPRIGAPLAALTLEGLIALGGKKFIACGAAGVLDKEIACGHLLVPTSAVRDEGTSYHYLPPGREVAASPEAVDAIKRVLDARNVEYLCVKTWTTDAFYRETKDKVELRKSEGCLSVEMEASAFFAVAQHRGVQFGQILYGGDSVAEEKWDPRGWTERTPIREKLLWLSVEACLEI